MAIPSPAPVVVFAYARPHHLRRTVESLLANPEASRTDIVFFCDAAKRPEHGAQVDAVRAFVEAVRGFRSVSRIYRERNMGLARSVIEGVTQTLDRYGRVIVLEDDLLLSPHFLRFMNEAIELYEDDARVASVHGYSYPTRDDLPETFFLQGADCWGWATWSRAWAAFEQDGRKLLRELNARRLSGRFDFDGQYPFTAMLEDQIAGRNGSWAILWHASCYLNNMLTLYPGRSLVENMGNDSSGTHCRTTDAFLRAPSSSPVRVGGIVVEPSEAARAAFVSFFAQQRSWRDKVRRSVKRIVGTIR